MKKTNSIICFVILLFSCLTASSVNAQNSHIKVLVLNSYHKGFAWTDNIVSGIESVLKPEENKLELVVEYMDTKATPYDEKYEQILFDLYRHKYHEFGFDIIISSDDNAFNFLRKYHDRLFPQTPVVVCGVNNSNAPNLIDSRLFTGVLETTATKETIDLILNFHTETKKIILIIDTTSSGNYRWKVIQPTIQAFKDIEFVRISDDFSIEEIENFLRRLDRDTAVIFYTLYRDNSGKYISVKDGVSRITKASSRPVYTTHLLELPYGVVGGKVLGGFHHGEFAAGIAQRILTGEKVSDLPFVKTSPTQYIFDYHQVKRWDIDNSSLPEDSIILNEPFSIYKEYKQVIWMIIFSLIILVSTVIVLQLNVRKRKQTEKQLKHNQRLLNKSQEIAHLGSWHLDIKKNILTWSDEQYRIFGVTPEEFGASYDAFLDTVHPDDRKVVDQTYSKAIEKNLPYECVHRIVRNNGDVRVVHEKSEHIFGEDGEIIQSFGFTQDITEQKKVEAALQESENKYRNFLESTFTVPWELDLESLQFTYMGYQIEQILGYPASSWKNFEIWTERIHPDDRVNAVRFCKTETEKGENHDFIYRATHKDGGYRWIRDLVSVVTDSGKPAKLIGFMQDITEQKELEHEQKQMEMKLQQSQKMEAIGTLAGGIAHDFNNILGIIVGYSEMAKEDCPPGSATIKHLDMVLEASHRAKNLVRQILTFSRQEPTKFVVFQPAHLVKKTIEMLRHTFPSTITISQHIDSKTGSIYADPSQFNQVMINLCTNSFHAMERTGGHLEVSLKETYLESGKHLNEKNINPGRYIVLSISDTGHGIPNEVKNKIFDPFYTTKETGKGTGMGLSIVYGIVKNFGGVITFNSERNKGCTFHVYVPVAQQKQRSTKNVTEQVATGKENVLFIDDEQMLAEMGKKMLERLGYNVTLSNSSTEALEIFYNQSNEFDLVITDQTMPNMTGTDLAKRMIQIRPDIPIILCTGFSSIISGEEAKLIGIKGFAYKPLTKKALSDLVRKVLDQTPR